MKKTADIIGLIAIVLMAIGIFKFAMPRRPTPAEEAKKAEIIKQLDDEARASQARLQASEATAAPTAKP